MASGRLSPAKRSSSDTACSRPFFECPQEAAAENDEAGMRAEAASGAQSAALAAVLEALNTGQRRMVAHMNANNKEVPTTLRAAS